MRALLRYCTFPLIVGGASIGAIVAMLRGVSPEIVLAVAAVACMVVIALLERLHPYLERYNRSHGDLLTDAIHSLVSGVALPEVLRVLTFGGLYAVNAALAGSIGMTVWPVAWPLWAQIAFGLLISDLGSYWFHRLQHNHPWWWRMHATHHSAPRLYWLNSGRFHPLDAGLSYMVAVFPLVILGAPAATIAGLTVFITAHGLLQHSNIEMKLGPLNWIFSTAELHRWHHSPVTEEANHNYGVVLIVWDAIFGTRFLPADRSPPAEVGIENMPHFPAGYWGQLTSLFRWRALEAKRGPTG